MCIWYFYFISCFIFLQKNGECHGLWVWACGKRPERSGARPAARCSAGCSPRQLSSQAHARAAVRGELGFRSVCSPPASAVPGTGGPERPTARQTAAVLSRIWVEPGSAHRGLNLAGEGVGVRRWLSAAAGTWLCCRERRGLHRGQERKQISFWGQIKKF